MSTTEPSGAQKQMLGERLYPLVSQMQPELAGEITGMLLDIDNTELLHLLESRESLEAKVKEAIAVLQAHWAIHSKHKHDVSDQGKDPLTATMLASVPPDVQKQMFGERLFPLISKICPDYAGKIIGMMLEIDNLELLHILESRESLEAKVKEAIDVLENHKH